MNKGWANTEECDKFHLGEALMKVVEAGPWRHACYMPDTCMCFRNII